MFASLIVASVAVLGVFAAPNPQLTTTIIITTTSIPTATATTITPIPTDSVGTTITISLPTTTVTATTPPPPAATCARHYSVKLGDTCNGISAAQSVSTFQLAFVNPIINSGCTNLFENEDLCLGITGQDCTTVHTVVDGDFCFAIAEAANIPLSTLLANNPNLDSECTNLRIGDVLCTSSTLFTYTQTA